MKLTISGSDINYGRILCCVQERKVYAELRVCLDERFDPSQITELEVQNGIHIRFNEPPHTDWSYVEADVYLMRISTPIDNVEWLSANVEEIICYIDGMTNAPVFFEQFINDSIPQYTPYENLVNYPISFNNHKTILPQFRYEETKLEFEIESLLDNPDDASKHPTIDWNDLGDTSGYDLVDIVSLWDFDVINVPDNYEYDNMWQRRFTVYVKPYRSGPEIIHFAIPVYAKHNKCCKTFRLKK